MNKKITNDENIKNLKKREKLRIAMIVFSLSTIILSFANLFFNVNLIFALMSCIITLILKKVRDNTPINLIKSDDLKEIRDEIKKNKRKYGKK